MNKKFLYTLGALLTLIAISNTSANAIVTIAHTDEPIKVSTEVSEQKTDEEKIGLTYNIIDNYIRNREIPEKMEDYERLRTLSDSTHHKNRILSAIPSPYRLMLDEEGKEHGGYF